MPYLVDTNVVSELTKRDPSPAVLGFLSENPDLFISVIVFHELEFGIHRAADAGRRARLQAFAVSLRRQFVGRIIDVDLEIAEMAGRLRAFEKSTGRILAELDALIGATAMVSGCILATRNVKDFETLSIPLLNPWESAV